MFRVAVIPLTAALDPAAGEGSSPGADAVASWLSRLADGAIGVAVTVGVCVLLYLLGQLIIRAVTRSIAKGLPVSRRARRALAQARIPLLDPTSQEYRLDLERRKRRATTMRIVMHSALVVLLFAIIVVAVLNALSVPLGPVLASAGVLGVALGFGAQSLVKDVIAGVFMLMEDQYGVGDVVDVGAATGTVEEFGLRATRLRSLDGTVWHVPNGQIQRVGNMTRLWSRVMLEVRFHYDTDLDAARTAMLDAVTAAAEAESEVAGAILNPAHVAGIESMTYNSVTLRLMVDVLPSTQWRVQRAVRRELRRILAQRSLMLAPPEAIAQIGVHSPDVRFDLEEAPRGDADPEHTRPTKETS